jgi:hypothetical protein
LVKRERATERATEMALGAGQESSASEFRERYDEKLYWAHICNKFPGPKGQWKLASHEVAGMLENRNPS